RAVDFIVRSTALVHDLIQRYEATTADLQTGVQFGYTTVPHLAGVEILGPYGISGPGDTASRSRLCTGRPTAPADETPCARKIIANLSRGAFRRSVTEDDIAPLLT